MLRGLVMNLTGLSKVRSILYFVGIKYQSNDLLS